MSKPISAESDAATPAMVEDNLLPFSFPAVERKKVTAAFDGGRITSDGGVMLLAAIEKDLGIADRLALRGKNAAAFATIASRDNAPIQKSTLSNTAVPKPNGAARESRPAILLSPSWP